MNVDSKAIDNDLSNPKKLQRKYGKQGLKKLLRALITLQTIENLSALSPPYSGTYRCHELKGKRHGQFAIWFTPKDRLVFTPVFDGDAASQKGYTWQSITHIRIEELIDYHV